MLHLLPIRLLLTVFAGAVVVVVCLGFYVELFAPDDPLDALPRLARWASGLSIGAIVALYALWRWVPAIQLAIFPYLGGSWAGEVRYFDENGVEKAKPVEMEAKHTLFGIRLLLESDESSSETLAVHAEKNPDFDRYRLFYIYLNRRHEGVKGAGEAYRGLAIVRWTKGSIPVLEGDYFTETERRGRLLLKRTKTNPAWKLWR
ncbi:MAG: hypothetical protein CL949_03960 [Erythrobacter sp.]|nr:hypothetical protein [Erythrobacter sp.]